MLDNRRNHSILVKRCGWQGYGVFSFLWQFFLPLAIFVVAYWKILKVVRRQAKVSTDRHRVTAPVAGTSATATASEQGNTESTKVTVGDEKREDSGPAKKATVTTRSGGHSQVKGQQKGSSNLSQAQINVVRTMVYITVCFTFCWMPINCYHVYKRATVSYRSRVLIHRV